MTLNRPDLKNLAASRGARAACAVSLSLAVTAALAPLPAFAQTAPTPAASSPAASAPSANPAGAQQPQWLAVDLLDGLTGKPVSMDVNQKVSITLRGLEGGKTYNLAPLEAGTQRVQDVPAGRYKITVQIGSTEYRGSMLAAGSADTQLTGTDTVTMNNTGDLGFGISRLKLTLLPAYTRIYDPQPQPIEVEQGGDVKPEMGIVDLDKYEGAVVSWEDGKAVDTSKPGSFTKKAVVRYADNSMDVVEVPITVKEKAAEKPSDPAKPIDNPGAPSKPIDGPAAPTEPKTEPKTESMVNEAQKTSDNQVGSKRVVAPVMSATNGAVKKTVMPQTGDASLFAAATAAVAGAAAAGAFGFALKRRR